MERHHKILRQFVATVLAIAAVCLCARVALAADVIETTDGLKIIGKIKRIHDGVVTITTDSAGDIQIKQSMVVSIRTDHPIAVRVADGTPEGTRYVGIVTPAAGDQVKIAGPRGTYEALLSKILASWTAGEEDPDVVARRRRWGFEADLDLSGATGTDHQLGIADAFTATLTGPRDKLELYTAYTRQDSGGTTSADQFKIGADYADNFTETASWYVKNEEGFDRIASISAYDIAGAGLGHDFIKNKVQALTVRAGLSYRYDKYQDDVAPDVSVAGADLGLQYSLNIWKAQLVDKISYDPAFKDPADNFVVSHDFSYVIPITKALWKLSLGVTNNYSSIPAPNVSRLQTLYFTRLVLTWGQRGDGTH